MTHDRPTLPPSPPPQRRCKRCAHYFITHHLSFPYGCRVLGFKSRGEPSGEVLGASGQECLYFQAKAARA